jgi:hypothetical protein
VPNEIAGNGLYSFFQALVTNEVNYDLLYARIDDARTIAHARELVATPNSRFLEPGDPRSLAREIRGSGHPRPMNVGPTLLDMDYHSLFFGRDLLRVPPDRRWVLTTYNRDVAFMRGNRLAVLGIRGARDVREVDVKGGRFKRLAPESYPALIEDAVAYCPSANRLYCERLLNPLPQVPLAIARP